jgi:hypothetical protein
VRDDEALRDASCEGHIDVVKLLIDAKANIHALDDQALRDAIYIEHDAIVQMFKRPMLG